MALLDTGTHIHIHVHTDHDKEAIAALSSKIDYVISQNKTIMSDFSQLKQSFEDLKSAITIERQQILDKLAEAEAKVTDLTGKLAAAGTEEERNALIADIQASIQQVKDIIPDPASLPV